MRFLNLVSWFGYELLFDSCGFNAMPSFFWKWKLKSKQRLQVWGPSSWQLFSIGNPCFSNCTIWVVHIFTVRLWWKPGSRAGSLDSHPVWVNYCTFPVFVLFFLDMQNWHCIWQQLSVGCRLIIWWQFFNCLLTRTSVICFWNAIWFPET